MCFFFVFVFVVLVWFEFVFAPRVRIRFAHNRQVCARSDKSKNMRTTHPIAERTVFLTKRALISESHSLLSYLFGWLGHLCGPNCDLHLRRDRCTSVNGFILYLYLSQTNKTRVGTCWASPFTRHAISFHPVGSIVQHRVESESL